MQRALAPRRPFLFPLLGSRNRPSRPLSARTRSEGRGNGGAEEEHKDEGKNLASSSAADKDPHIWTTAQAAAAAFGWSDEASKALLASTPKNARILDLPLSAIRRPLAGSRADDQLKVEALAASIREHGQREPVDVLECPPGSQKYFGFSGCHRFAAMRKLGRETIRCRVRGVSEATLRMHLA